MTIEPAHPRSCLDLEEMFCGCGGLRLSGDRPEFNLRDGDLLMVKKGRGRGLVVDDKGLKLGGSGWVVVGVVRSFGNIGGRR